MSATRYTLRLGVQHAVLMVLLAMTTTGVATKSLAASKRSRGNEDIGGGDAVWVAYGQENLAYLLDYYMGLRLGYIANLDELAATMGPAQGEDPVVKVHRVIARIRRVDGDLAARAEATFALFQTIAVFSPGVIEPVNDENLEFALATDAELVQAAKWTSSPDGDMRSFVVTKSVWDRFDQVDRAGLVLHEIFYVMHAKARDDADQSGQHDARGLRRFVATISSRWMTQASPDDFKRFLAQADLF